MGHSHAHPQRGPPAIPRQQGARAVGHDLAYNEHPSHDEGRNQEIHGQLDINQHSDGHEEQGGEHIPDRTHDTVHFVGMLRVAQHRAHQESTGRGRQAQLLTG